MTPSPLEDRLDEMPPPRGQISILVICLLLNLADGFDVLAMSYAAPVLVEAWSIDPKQLGGVFSAALVGMALGSLFLAPLADVFGRRTMILVAAAFVSVSMFGTAVSESVWHLMALRFFAGLGIGIIVPLSATLATEYAPARIRNTSVVLVSAGFSIGAVSAGLVAGEVIQAWDWHGLFVAGGIITALLFIIALIFLPESVHFVAASTSPDNEKLRRINEILATLPREPITSLPPRPSQTHSRGNVLQLFVPGLRISTAQLWILWFAFNWTSYLVVNWVPTLLLYDGYSAAQGIDALTYFTMGALAGSIALGLLSARFVLPPMVALMTLSSGLLLALWVAADLAFSIQKVVLAGAGFMFSGTYGFWAIAGTIYRPEVRATGLGWSGGFGRIGAIVSPLVGGYAVAAGWTLEQMMLTLVVPVLALSAGLVIRVSRRGQPKSSPRA